VYNSNKPTLTRVLPVQSESLTLLLLENVRITLKKLNSAVLLKRKLKSVPWSFLSTVDGSHKKSSALSILVQSMAATDVLLALKKM